MFGVLIVDQLQSRTTAGRVERSARLRWIGGELRLSIEVPEGFEAPEDDATGFMLIALPLALYRGEDLQVDGAVSRLTLRQTERIQAIYASWDPVVRRCRVRVAAELPPRETPAGHGCLLSRGIDSMYSATSAHDTALTHLVFCDTLAPLQGARLRAEELELVEAAAELIGLPLLRISTNLRDARSQLIDYQDLHGAGIAFMAHALGGGLGRLVVPSGLTYSVAGPAGSHPLLDPLFASESLALDHHGLELGRPGKVAALVARRPELLAYTKACQSEETNANCGRCRKCIWTMVALQAAGGLGLASMFPPEIDLDALSRLRVVGLPLSLFWMQAAESLGESPEERRVREAVRRMLRRSARPSPTERASAALDWLRGDREHPAAYLSTSPSAHFRVQTNAVFAALRSGTPYPCGIESATPQPAPAWSVGPLEEDWGPPLRPSGSLVGLLRLLDLRGRRHRYLAGPGAPPEGAVRVGELGALLRDPGAGCVPAWIGADGRLSTDGYRPGAPELRSRTVARWVLAPLRWAEAGSTASRLRELVRRSGDAVTALRGEEPRAELRGAAPAGYLDGEDAEGRLALYSSIHPVNGDQLLSADPSECTDLGYNAPVLLGYLQASAPASGSLAVSRALIPWASRFGQVPAGVRR